MISYKTADTITELQQILSLQQQNLPKNLSEEEQKEQGFLTVEHTLGVLQKMNAIQPHIIAVSNDKVVGYALCMHKSFKKMIPVLVPMFTIIDSFLDTNVDYMVMGQICIDKNYRKKGIFRGLYTKMTEEVSDKYDAIITEVDALNIQSSNAHKAVGFEELTRYESGGQQWELIIMNLKNQ
jgi:ribosomal protein S18 acetylase RimI-like enzyme